MDKRTSQKALSSALDKLTDSDKLEILRHVVILPMIEEDKSLSQEELGDALLSGKKMGFAKEKIIAEINDLVAEVGAVIEKD